MQLSKYVIAQQCEVLAALLRTDGALRLYSGAEPDISQRTDGRLVSATITEVTIEGSLLTIKYDAAVATKEGTASYFRLVSKNIPVLSDTLTYDFMPDKEIKVGTKIDAGILLHNVFKN